MVLSKIFFSPDKKIRSFLQHDFFSETAILNDLQDDSFLHECFSPKKETPTNFPPQKYFSIVKEVVDKTSRIASKIDVIFENTFITLVKLRKIFLQ